MPQKPQFSDYEPVTKPKSSKRLDEETLADDGGFGSWTAKPVNLPVDEPWEGFVSPAVDDNTPRFPNQGGDGGDTVKRPPPRPVNLLQENWVGRRGHAVSFFGLFLFSFVLYFRPYEWSTSLMWASSLAFWLATFTLLVFIPTQLALENNLTTRPLEVNLVLLLLVTGLLSFTFALDRETVWWSWVEYLKVVTMFIVMVNVVRTEKRLRALLWLVLIASIWVSVASINDYRLGILALEGKRIEGAIGGLLSNPNDVALHLVTMIPIVFGLFLSTRNPFAKLVYIACALLFIGGIVVTFSRSGFLGFAVAVFVLAWKLAPRNRIVFAVLGLILIAGVFALAPSAFRSRLGTTSDASAQARTDDLKRSLFVAARNPFVGIGMGNYIFYSNLSKATHNAYTQVAAEMGLTAAVFYIIFLIAPLKKLRRIELENRDLPGRKPRVYHLALTLQASLLGFMVASFFSSVAYFWYPYYLVGYAICVRRIYSHQKELAAARVATAA